MISRNISRQPKMIALISIYRAISQYIDYRDRPNYAQMIYMLSQCKDAIDNPVALFARIERLARDLKNLNFGGYSRRVNQSGACSSSDVITSGGRKSQTTMEDK